MCFSKPKPPQVIQQVASAAPAPAPSEGAQALILGPSANPTDDEELRNQGVLGRLALMVGRSGVGTPGSAGTGRGVGGSGRGVGGGSTGTGGSSSGGGSSSSSSGLTVGSSSGGGKSGGGEPPIGNSGGVRA